MESVAARAEPSAQATPARPPLPRVPLRVAPATTHPAARPKSAILERAEFALPTAVVPMVVVAPALASSPRVNVLRALTAAPDALVAGASVRTEPAPATLVVRAGSIVNWLAPAGPHPVLLALVRPGLAKPTASATVKPARNVTVEAARSIQAPVTARPRLVRKDRLAAVSKVARA